ncbi:SCO family protein [Fimbriimonas ginsengisoli]|uniref:Electron transport protein SCO1/SenC n=1 Tax=Fimbriimonas ginsengisoli Gsoil 348 TaxID=661478 RepID=A0A068NS48_FIMGI|nr:SCO family protein [Fimbriimonas ginsengisoli]AIE85555.1 electron transport protein SCO1/SenC [Fimbriimonas ginsengisoli Gsoil 348]
MKPNAMNPKTTKAALLALCLGLAAFAPAQDGDRKNESPLARTMGITQRLGQPVPKDVEFKDEDGKTIRFGDLMGKRPMIILPIFFQCRTGCPLITDATMKTLAKANKVDNELVPGRDVEMVLLSIDPLETPELARAKKQLVLNAMEPPNAPEGWRENASKGWHLLTGDLESIHKVTDAIGFKYKFDPVKHLINHPTCTVMLTPSGRVSSYTIGNDFPTRVIQQNFAVAKKEEIGDKADQSMMFGCIMLDPVTGKYRIVVENVMRVAGVLTIVVVGLWIFLMSRNSKREERLRGLDPRALKRG